VSQIAPQVTLQKRSYHKTFTLPPSKSHTLRAILFASLAEGVSTIDNVLDSPDTFAMIRACSGLGAQIVEKNGFEITGRAGSCRLQTERIDAQNSGQVLRFVAAVCALSNEYVLITGDHSIRRRRVIKPLLDGLCSLGAFAVSCGNNNLAPIIVRGPIKPGHVVIDGSDSQPVSALLIAASQLSGTTCIEVENIGEKPWLALTFDWLKRMQVHVTCENENRFFVTGKPIFSSFCYKVASDLSALMYPVALGLCTDSFITIEDVDVEDVQGDKEVLTLFEKMGAKFSYDYQGKRLSIQGPQELTGIDIDVNSCVDALPLLAVMGCWARGKMRLYNGAICRYKESDRIAAITGELRKMGAKIIEHDDGLTVHHSTLSGTTVFSQYDHRIALSLAVASHFAKGSTTITHTQCVQKSYPTFFEDLENASDGSLIVFV